MKKSMIVITLVIGLLSSCCKHVDMQYNNVDVFNRMGNVVDFRFSYDGCNECMNNFMITNNTAIQLNYNFDIYQNGMLVYTGYFQTAPYGKVYFNDAFQNCNSNGAMTTVTIYGAPIDNPPGNVVIF